MTTKLKVEVRQRIGDAVKRQTFKRTTRSGVGTPSNLFVPTDTAKAIALGNHMTHLLYIINRALWRCRYKSQADALGVDAKIYWNAQLDRLIFDLDGPFSKQNKAKQALWTNHDWDELL